MIAYLTQAELNALPHYQLSLPTGLYTGKEWKVKCKDGWIRAKVIHDELGYGIQWDAVVIVDEEYQWSDWVI